METKTIIIKKSDGKTILSYDFLYEAPLHINYLYKVLGASHEVELEVHRTIDLITENTIVRKIFVIEI